MVLESTMLCLDNSEWMRNGVPSRIDAQQDAASMLCTDRINSNPENTVGILTMAGKGVDLLVSPTEEQGKILAAFGHVKLGGKSDLSTAIQIAQLALKHRKNKNGAQRIIVFVGSPVPDAVEALQKLGKQLKKNNVALDLISIGESDGNTDKLQELVNATNSSDNSHLITVPAGVSPANALLASSLMNSSSMAAMGGGAAGGGGDNFDMYGGVDPSMDPELAMAIRVSAEEARAMEPSGGGAVAMEQDEEESEEALMQRALEMSMRDAAGQGEGDGAGEGAEAGQADELDEDEELARALAMSVEEHTPAAEGSAFMDPDFVQQLLGSADLSDPMVQAALAQLQASEQQGEDKEDKDEKSRKRKSDP